MHVVKLQRMCVCGASPQGVARAFPDGWFAHREGQNEKENEINFRKNKRRWLKFEESGTLAIQNCEAGYSLSNPLLLVFRGLSTKCSWETEDSYTIPKQKLCLLSHNQRGFLFCFVFWRKRRKPNCFPWPNG